MEKTLAEQKDLLFLALCAFLEEDYAHCSVSNLNVIKIGEKNIKKLLHELERDGKINNKTINGFYGRYEIHCPRKCPDFVFNPELTLTNKLFILYCIENLKDLSPRPARQLALDLRNSEEYTFESKQLTQIKKALGCSLFDYLKNVSYTQKRPFHTEYNLIKKESGYQVDSEVNAQIYRNLPKNEVYKIKRDNRIKYRLEKGVGYFLYMKLKVRINNDKDRFGECNITPEFLDELYLKQEGCDFYTKLPFTDLTKISIDRIDSSKSYTVDNIVLTTITINTMKSNLSVNEFIGICKQIAAAN